jgi:hypothetical protein
MGEVFIVLFPSPFCGVIALQMRWILKKSAFSDRYKAVACNGSKRCKKANNDGLCNTVTV